MFKFTASVLAVLGTLAWSAEEVATYAQGLERVGEDGWVLLCHSADWDSSHDEQWLRRQSSVRSSCGNALVLYVPIYQNPTPEQQAAQEDMLRGASVELHKLDSVPCALLLDQDGRPYATVSGDAFTQNAASHIREAQAQLRTRCNLLRQAAMEEGSQKAQTLSRIWRLSITPPPNLKQRMLQADPEDSAGIAEWSPFDPWKLAERIRTLPWQEAMNELDRIDRAQLSKEERQAVLAIRMSCIYHHLGAAGSQEIRKLATECTALAPASPLGKAARRAASLWGNKLKLSTGWNVGQLPTLPAECEIAETQVMAQAGEFRIGIVPIKGKSPVRVTRVTLYDGSTKVSEDAHSCCLRAGETLEHHEYMLFVREAPAHPRLVIAFDQQGEQDSMGLFTLRYFNKDGVEKIRYDKTAAAMEQARLEDENSARETTADAASAVAAAAAEADAQAAEKETRTAEDEAGDIARHNSVEQNAAQDSEASTENLGDSDTPHTMKLNKESKAEGSEPRVPAP